MSNIFFDQSDLFLKIEFLQLNIAVYRTIAHSVYRLYTKMLRIHLFSIFIMNTPRALAAPLNRKDTDNCTLYYF